MLLLLDAMVTSLDGNGFLDIEVYPDLIASWVVVRAMLVDQITSILLNGIGKKPLRQYPDYFQHLWSELGIIHL